MLSVTGNQPIHVTDWELGFCCLYLDLHALACSCKRLLMKKVASVVVFLILHYLYNTLNLVPTNRGNPNILTKANL